MDDARPFDRPFVGCTGGETRSKIGGQAFQQFSPMPEASPHGTMGAERRVE